MARRGSGLCLPPPTWPVPANVFAQSPRTGHGKRSDKAFAAGICRLTKTTQSEILRFVRLNLLSFILKQTRSSRFLRSSIGMRRKPASILGWTDPQLALKHAPQILLFAISCCHCNAFER